MLDRLVIGTANWGRDYNGHNVSGKEQNLIMEYMKEVGIEWLDVATAYGTQFVGTGQFHRFVKSPKEKYQVTGLDRLLAHSVSDYSPEHHQGFSIYKDEQLPVKSRWYQPRWVEFTYSVFDRQEIETRFRLKSHGDNYIARSIFCKGKALKYFSPRDCIDFVLMNPRIDKAIIGVDSVDQLRENVVHLVKMETFTHNEEVDTRKL